MAANDTTLFVICHGSWSFLDMYMADPQQIVARPPNMGADHVYRCGSWLAEHEINRGSMLRLVNVTGLQDHQKKFDETVNFIAPHSQLGSVATHGPLCSFILPAPIAIHSLGQLVIPQGHLTLDGQPIAQDQIVSLIQAFEYTYDSTQPAQIEAMIWSPIAIPDAKTGQMVATLHLFAEHEAGGDDEHLQEAFQDCYTLLAHTVVLDPSGVVPLDPSKQRPLPPLLGPRCFELEPIGSRTDRMAVVGQLKGTVDASGQSADLRQAWPQKNSGCLEGILPNFFATPNIGGRPRTTVASCVPGGGSCP